MSPTLELSPATFSRLQKHAVPLVDTIESVINRVLDDFETKSGAPVEPADSPQGHAPVRQFNPSTPPNLTHTKVLAIEFDGKPLARGEANRNGLLYAAVREAKARSKVIYGSQEVCNRQLRRGREIDRRLPVLVGYRPVGSGPGREWRVESC